MAPTLRWIAGLTTGLFCGEGANLRASQKQLGDVSPLSTLERSSALHALADAAVELMLSDAPNATLNGSTVAGIMDKAVAQMSLDTATRVVALPPEVTRLLLARKGKRVGGLEPMDVSATDGQDAVAKLNAMALAAQERMDNKVIECNQFKARNRQTMAQVQADVTRFGQIVADLQRSKSKALSGISHLGASATQAREEQELSRIEYEQARQRKTAQLELLKQDYLTATGILKTVRCPNPAMLQRGGRMNGTLNAMTLEVCNISDATEVALPNHGVSNASLLSPDAQQMLAAALGRLSPAGNQARVLQGLTASGMDLEDGTDDEPEPNERTIAQALQPVRSSARSGSSPDEYLEAFKQQNASESQKWIAMQVSSLQPVSKTRVKKGVSKRKQARKCIRMEPECEMVHEVFASIWGKIKDSQDELSQRIAWDDVTQRGLEAKVNLQLQAITNQQGELQSSLAEATSGMASEVEAQTQKVAQGKALEKVYKKTRRECKATVEQIKFVELCGLVKVRNAIMESLTMMPATDCTVGNFVSSQCSKQCDDTLAGGVMTVRREIVTSNNEHGTPCPALSRNVTCNQIRCPVDCKVGAWSLWAKCSKNCGGGMQTRTRGVDVSPQSGGQACDSVQESRACNTGSCDRNCRLRSWTRWSGCTQACGVGHAVSKRSVRRGRRGAGTCPSRKSRKRRRTKSCNTQPCVGDEVCIAKMDMVLALDASGSITQEGFELLKDFASRLVGRLRKESYGQEAMRVSVVQFGNGRLNDDNVPNDVILKAPLTSDLRQVQTTIAGMQWSKGFTNVAQAMIKAKDVLSSGSRSDAVPYVLLVTDGAPTFSRQAKTAAKALRSIARFQILQVKGFPSKDEQKLLKGLVSMPYQSNFLFIPGKKALKGALDGYVTRTLVKLCPRAESPSYLVTESELLGFRRHLDGVTCGPPDVTSYEIDPESCAAMAESMGSWKAFAFDGDNCLVYHGACSAPSRNSTYKVYVPVATEQQQLLR